LEDTMLRVPSDIAAFIIISSDPNPIYWQPAETVKIRRFCSNCECFGIVIHGTLTGTLMFEKDGSVHLSRLPFDKRKPFHRQDLEGILSIVEYGLQKYGSLKAKIKNDNQMMQKIAVKAGFSFVKTDGNYSYFTMDTIALDRKVA